VRIAAVTETTATGNIDAAKQPQLTKNLMAIVSLVHEHVFDWNDVGRMIR